MSDKAAITPATPPPGVLIRSGRWTRGMAENVRRSSQLTADAGIEVVKTSTGQHIRNSRLPAYWVRVRQQTEDGVPHAYDGWRIAVGDDLSITLIDDLDEGPFFTRDKYPLLEMRGLTNVPDDTIVYATPGAGGAHYEFIAATGLATSSHPVGCSCCCCCVPCAGDVVVHVPQFIPYKCVPIEDGFTVPAFDMVLNKDDDGCWRRCSEPVQIYGEPGFAVMFFTGEAEICCDPLDPRRCPSLRIRGAIVITDGGTNELPLGSYDICVGPIDMQVFGCHQKDEDDPRPPFGTAVHWGADVSQDALNNCDRANWDCDGCYVLFGAPGIQAKCYCDDFCPDTGIPDSFAVTIHSSYEPLNNQSGTMVRGGEWPFPDIPSLLGADFACATSYWIGHGTLTDGCRWFAIYHCHTAPLVRITYPLGGSSSSECFIAAGAFFTLHQTLTPLGQASRSCNPFCLIYRRQNPGSPPTFGGDAVCFGTCPECPEASPPPDPEPPDPPGPGEGFRLLAGLSYTDTAGTTPATDEADVIRLLVEPGDDPQAPSGTSAVQASSGAPMITTGPDNGRPILMGGSGVNMGLSTPVSIDLSAGDMTIIAAIRRPTNKAIVPVGGNGSGDPGAWIDASNNVQFHTDLNSVSVGYTGSAGDILAIWTVERGEVFFQSTGMAKTSLGTLPLLVTEPITLTHLFARTGAPLSTDAECGIYDIGVWNYLFDPGDLADLIATGGYYDAAWGVTA